MLGYQTGFRNPMLDVVIFYIFPALAIFAFVSGAVYRWMRRARIEETGSQKALTVGVSLVGLLVTPLLYAMLVQVVTF
jgi:hypothetical protein